MMMPAQPRSLKQVIVDLAREIGLRLDGSRDLSPLEELTIQRHPELDPFLVRQQLTSLQEERRRMMGLGDF
jgi:hypothetical protein